MAPKRIIRVVRIVVSLCLLATGSAVCLPGNGLTDDVVHEIANLKDPARGIREAAARNLGEMGDARAVPGLIAALKDEDLEIRVVAIQSLAQLKDSRAIEPVTSLLNEKADRESVGYAILALGEFKDARAVAALVDALKRATREGDAGAASSLGRIGALAVPPLLAELSNRALRARVLDALGWIDDPRAVDALIGFVNDPDPVLREAAVTGLKGHRDAPGMLLAPFDVVNWYRSLDRTNAPMAKDPRVPILLIGALENSDVRVQSAAVHGLGDFKISAAIDPLIGLLHEPVRGTQTTPGREPLKLRKDVVIALGEIGGAKAVDALIAEMSDSDEEVRSWSAWSSGMTKDPRTTEALVVLLNDKNGNVRREAADALAQIKDPRAAGPLIEAVKNASTALEATLSEAKSRMKGSESGVLPAAAFSAGDPILGTGTYALGQIGEPAVPLLIEAMRSTDSVFRQRMLAALGGTKAPSAVDTIIGALSDTDAGVRSAALEALAGAKDPRAQQPFVRAWEDADPEARKDATGFLCANDAPWAAGPLVIAIKDKNSDFAERCLNPPGEVRTPSAEALVPLLNDPDNYVRGMAARAMAALVQDHLLFDRPAGPTGITAENALRESLKQRNAAVICAAYSYFVGRGEEGSEDALIEALNAAGDHWMAEYLLICGNAKLEIAGRAWLKEHHLEIESRILGPIWGQLRVRPVA